MVFKMEFVNVFSQARKVLGHFIPVCLNSLHVREVAKPLNHDSVDLRDAFAAIQLVHKNNCAARLNSYKKTCSVSSGSLVP